MPVGSAARKSLRRRVLCLALFAATAIAPALALPAVAGAMTWGTAVLTAPPSGPYQATLKETAVSCPSEGACSAVGTYTDANDQTQGALLDQTGGNWSSSIEAVLPAGASAKPAVSLTAISCASAGNCTAVGTYLDAQGETQGLLVTETSGSWAAGVEAPLPGDAGTNPNVGLPSVSCGAAGDCSAVGYYENSSNSYQPLVLTLSAGGWANSPVTLPTGDGTNYTARLAAVSCPSAGTCSAVGYDSTSAGGSQGLLVSEVAGSWQPASFAGLPAGAATSNAVRLLGISCWTAGGCTAVGDYLDSGSDTQALTISESGSVWASRGTEVLQPAGTDGLTADLYSISCTASEDCTALGYYQVSYGNSPLMLATETGGVWGQAAGVGVPSGGSLPAATLSCSTPDNCVAVGDYRTTQATATNSLLVTDVNGSISTAAATLPANATTDVSDLTAVACLGDGTCTGVGYYFDTAHHQNGMTVVASTGTWASATELASPAGAGFVPNTESYPSAFGGSSISCPAAGGCSAAGSYKDGNILRTVSPVQVQHPQTFAQNALGVWSSATSDAPLPANADPASGLGQISEISCPQAGDCSAAGYYGNGQDTSLVYFVSETNGVWQDPTEATLPAGNAEVNSATVNGVSCATVGNCVAVGSYATLSNNQSTEHGLIFTETNGTWGAGQNAPDPGNVNATFAVIGLNGVSCPSVGNCSAEGSYTDTSQYPEGELLTETNGAWTATEAAPPADAATDPDLGPSSIACSSAGNCVVAGLYTLASSGSEEPAFFSEVDGTWQTGVDAPLPADASSFQNAINLSVSCPAAGQCVAVGTDSDRTGYPEGVEFNESSGWSSMDVTPPANAYAGAGASSRLSSVSCATAGDCEAVGTYEDGSRAGRGMFVDGGTGWGRGVQLQLPATVSSDASDQLTQVSCAADGSCGATGSYTDAYANPHGLLVATTSDPQLTADGPATDAVGTAISAADMPAVLSGTYGGTGQIAFHVFGPTPTAPTNCASGAISLGSTTVAGNGTYDPPAGWLPTTAGDYWWYATYSGDSANAATTSPCGAAMAETIVTKATPTIYSNDLPSGVQAGQQVPASAIQFVLSGGDYPTGSMDFTVFGPSASAPTDCSSGGSDLGRSSVSGDGTYDPPYSWTPTAVGTYWFYAAYGGDSDNTSVTTCGASLSSLTVAAASPQLALTAPQTAPVSEAIAPAALQAELSGGADESGTITYTVYGPQASPPTDCLSGGTPAGAASVSGDGGYAPSSTFTPASTGTYWWYASYDGDANNASAASTCGAGMSETVVVPPVIISELRLFGPGGADDRYVDLQNIGAGSQDLSGWSIDLSDGTNQSTVPLSGTIPSQGHLLIADSGYSVAGGAAPDITASFGSVSPYAGVRLRDGSELVDAVGFDGGSSSNPGAPSDYYLGTPIPADDPSALSGAPAQYAWTRVISDGEPLDTADNASDFQMVATDADGTPADAGSDDNLNSSVEPVFGSPDPQSLSSPMNVNDGAQAGLLDLAPTGGAGSCGSSAETKAPNCVFTPSADGPGNESASAPGSMAIRRTITNCFGAGSAPVGSTLAAECANAGPAALSMSPQSITRLVLAVTGLTTYGTDTDPSQALLRAVSFNGATPETVTTSTGSASVQGLALDATSGPAGGGVGSTWTVPLPGGSLAPGQSVDVEFDFAVDQTGSYSFGFNTLDDLKPYAASTPPTPTPITTSTTTTATTATSTTTPPAATPPADAASTNPAASSDSAVITGSLGDTQVKTKLAKPKLTAPTSVVRGGLVKLTGVTGGVCAAGSKLVIRTNAFTRSARVSVVRVSSHGSFSLSRRVPLTTRVGTYLVTATCGGRELASTHLKVTNPRSSRRSRRPARERRPARDRRPAGSALLAEQRGGGRLGARLRP